VIAACGPPYLVCGPPRGEPVILREGDDEVDQLVRVIGWRDQLAFLSMTFPSSGDMETSGQGPGRAYYDRDSQKVPSGCLASQLLASSGGRAIPHLGWSAA